MKKFKTEILIIGSGAAGATLARELSARKKRVIVAEKGFFITHFGNMFLADKFYDRHGMLKSIDGINVYRGIGVGGSTLISCGNGLRVLSNKLNKWGIDLIDEFEETEKDLHLAPLPDRLIGEGTNRIIKAAKDLNITMGKMPKFIDPNKCSSCGNCIWGCSKGAKWTSVSYINEAIERGATVLTGIEIIEILVKDGRAIGAKGMLQNHRQCIFEAEKIVVSAGALDTPLILKKTGLIEAGENLFLDLFNVTYGFADDIAPTNEPPMSVVSTDFYEKDGYILSTFIDRKFPFALLLPKKKILCSFKRNRVLGLMTKINDDNNGKVFANGKFEKHLTTDDLEKLKKGTATAKKILLKMGVKEDSIFVTKIRGVHPGGTAALGRIIKSNFETKIKQLYVCDASVFPCSPGLPPIVTIVALAKKLAKVL